MLLNHKKNGKKPKVLSNTFKVSSIIINHKKSATLKDINGNEQEASCMSCIDQPCMTYSKKELQVSELRDFASDINTNVCATNAIKWDDTLEYPTINEGECIACGVCATRCPPKAIYITENSAKINITNLLPDASSNEEHREHLDHLNTAKISGEFFVPTQESCENSINKINKLKLTQKLDPNLLVRNLLISLGVKSIAYRQGVQYSTIDVIGVYEGNYIALEVELDNSLIDTPRNLITSAAILFERHGWLKQNTKFFSIGLKFPNRREEFWNVLEDIDKILDIKINFLTVVGLFFLVWLRKPFIASDERYYIHNNKEKSIRNSLDAEEQLTKIRKGFLGLLEPEK